MVGGVNCAEMTRGDDDSGTAALPGATGLRASTGVGRTRWSGLG